ncbi:MAG: ribbon-helix-helix domain-containing protein [Nitrosospira sp.]|nr:ribbon-helix-helix domain-containing protein [Nitrosospira sp.]MDN5881199.1 ribbon-helix-helix domain-containing protein [Nitrosospira sp.]MDN5935680.1 ribbon-helix-helix domain-containing protein [Nitrosospira sp.]
MRTLIDIPDKQIKELAVICKAEKLSRSEAVRQALTAYLEKKKPGKADAFGIWKDREVDGLTYQKKMREEW